MWGVKKLPIYPNIVGIEKRVRRIKKNSLIPINSQTEIEKRDPRSENPHWHHPFLRISSFTLSSAGVATVARADSPPSGYTRLAAPGSPLPVPSYRESALLSYKCRSGVAVNGTVVGGRPSEGLGPRRERPRRTDNVTSEEAEGHQVTQHGYCCPSRSVTWSVVWFLWVVGFRFADCCGCLVALAGGQP